MKNKLLITTLLSMLLLLGGCQLALPEGEAGNSLIEDKMVGVFITRESLDPADGKIYADKVSESRTNANGETSQDWSFQFTKLDGYLLASYLKTDEASGQEFRQCVILREGLSETSQHLTSGDTNSGVVDNATIYLTKEARNVRFFMNPVYQDAKGELYLTAGTGIHTNMTDGGELSQSISAKTTYKKDGNITATYSYDCTLHIKAAEVADSVVILYMDASHQELNRETYRPGELPTELTAPANTAYLLIEEHYTDKVLHKICQPEDKSFKIFYEIEHHICVPRETKVT